MFGQRKQQKRKGLAHAISESQKRLYAQSGAYQVSSLKRAFTDSGANEMGEITENISSVPPSISVHGASLQGASVSNAVTTVSTNAFTRGRENGRGRGRGRRPFVS